MEASSSSCKFMYAIAIVFDGDSSIFMKLQSQITTLNRTAIVWSVTRLQKPQMGCPFAKEEKVKHRVFLKFPSLSNVQHILTTILRMSGGSENGSELGKCYFFNKKKSIKSRHKSLKSQKWRAWKRKRGPKMSQRKKLRE